MKRGKIVRYTSEELAAMRRADKSQTDWKRVVAMRDEDIVFDEDSPELDEACFAQAVRNMPAPKARVTLRLDQDVVAWFKAQGKGYQERINVILRAYMEAQQARVK
jgi:uncharacterized protein (DUF4415 family)